MQCHLRASVRWPVVVAVGCQMLLPGISYAAEWTLSKSVSLSEVYTDNVNLDNANRKSRFTTQITPSMSLQGKGGRASVNLSGSLRYDTGGGNGGGITPNLNGSANAELIRDRLFVDANASVSLNAIDPFGDIGLDNVNNTGNTTTTAQYSISPYYKNRIKDVGNFETRYRYTNTSHSSGSASGSASHEISASLTSGPNFARLNWGLDANYRTNSGGGTGGSSSDLLSTDANLGYRFDRQWSVNGSIGRKWNDFATTRSSNDGFRWTASANWTPNPRTSLRIGYGGRFFGATPTLDFSYKSRRSTITASYSRTVTDANSQLEALTIAQDPQTGNVTISPVAVLINDVYVNERFSGSYSLKGKRTTLTLNGSQSTQSYQNSSQCSELSSLGLALSRTLSGKVSANAGVN